MLTVLVLVTVATVVEAACYRAIPATLSRIAFIPLGRPREVRSASGPNQAPYRALGVPPLSEVLSSLPLESQRTTGRWAAGHGWLRMLVGRGHWTPGIVRIDIDVLSDSFLFRPRLFPWPLAPTAVVALAALWMESWRALCLVGAFSIVSGAAWAWGSVQAGEIVGAVLSSLEKSRGQ